jgi:hypothetical protein
MGVLGSVHFRLVRPSNVSQNQMLINSVMLTLSALFVPETFAPTLLRRKAKRLQKEANELGTGEVFISKYDKVVKPRSEIIRVGMSRPFDMMFRELIVAALGLYGEYSSSKER